MPHAQTESLLDTQKKFDSQIIDNVIDIGGSKVARQTFAELQVSFVEQKKRGKRPSLPEELLYDDKGLDLWSELIYHPNYYQTRDETELLKANGKEIASHIPANALLIDLGAGDTRKVGNLLDILDETFKSIQQRASYYALDISLASLKINVSRLLDNGYNCVDTFGLWGTFADLNNWISPSHGPRVFLSLGSVLFNDSWDRAVKNLRIWADTMRQGDLILAGMDGHSIPDDKDKIWSSYHGKGSKDLWNRFWDNGFSRANEVAKGDIFRRDDWQVRGSVKTHPVSHQFTFCAKKDIDMKKLGIHFKAGEEFDWFDAHKNGEQEVERMCAEVDLKVIKVWRIPGSKMYQYLISRGSLGHGERKI